MFNWFTNLFNNKWKAIDTIPIYYTNANQERVFTMSVTFYMGINESRKIEIDYDKSWKRVYSPFNHPFYHSFCVPYLKKTGEFEGSNEIVAKMINVLAEEQTMQEIRQLRREAEKSKGKENLKVLLDKKGKPEKSNNVLSFPDIKKDIETDA